jgi:hypothetical protein
MNFICLSPSSIFGRGVGRDDRARARHLTLDETQGSDRVAVAKEALAATHDERIDHYPDLVEQVVLDQ